MPSPFPGMDPYLEAPDVWPECHASLIAAMRAHLNARLPAGYVASMDVHVWVQEGNGGDGRTVIREPDLPVIDHRNRAEPAGPGGAVAAPSTVVVPVPDREETHYLRIVNARSRRVVSVVELLSPSNKTQGRDRDAYLAKRAEYLAARVNLVEIDLLRAGVRPPMEGARASDYYALVCWAALLPKAGFWAVGVRERLPELPVPLSGGEPNCPLELQSCFDRAYDEGRYPLTVDYTQPPVPPLGEPDAAWARDLLARAVPNHQGDKT